MNSEDTELTQLREEAVDEYLNKSKGGKIDQKWKTPLNTQADLEKLIEQHEFDFSRFRSSRGKFWTVLMGTCRQLQTLGNVAQAGLGLTPFAPASVIVKSVFSSSVLAKLSPIRMTLSKPCSERLEISQTVWTST